MGEAAAGEGMRKRSRASRSGREGEGKDRGREREETTRLGRGDGPKLGVVALRKRNEEKVHVSLGMRLELRETTHLVPEAESSRGVASES